MGPVLAGQKLTVEVYDRGHRRRLATGSLATIDNQVDPTTGTVKLKAQFDNRHVGLFPNQFVNVRLVIETLRDATLVPGAAIQYGPKGPFVFAVAADDTITMRPVTLGPSEGERIAVTAGIEPGTRVVTSGTDRLRDGTKVKQAAETASTSPRGAP
jgi:multidrug efflux system membrane fusion protein